MTRALSIAVVTTLLLAAPAHAVNRPDTFPWFDPAGIRGSLVIHGGGELPDTVRDKFLELAGGKEARIVVIPTASAAADAQVADPRQHEQLLEPWKSAGAADVQVLHTASKEQASEPGLVESLTTATAVWFGGGDQTRIAATYLDTAVERELVALLSRGGVIGGTSAGAAIQSKEMIAGGQAEPKMGVGFDLLPGAIIDQHFLARKRRERLVAAIALHPGLVGFGVDEATALVVEDRKLQVVGNSTVTVVLAAGPGRPAREFELKADETHDLTMLRRAATERTLAEFPPRELPPTRVDNGSLMLVGGGGMGDEMVGKFIELAGGPDAPIVVLPTAAGDGPADGSGDVIFFERAGAKNVKTVNARVRAEIESVESLALLKEAKGLWFGGGRQWRFVDAYAGTKAEELFRDVLKRGGVIGGSSAGATIQAQYLVRGSVLGNTDIMADGYERGLGFLPGAAVDQHFAQRNRQPDMTSVMLRHPQLLGIGIDEGTALIVRGSIGEIMGAGQVAFYDYRTPPSATAPDFTAVKAGDRYDLAERKMVAE